MAKIKGDNLANLLTGTSGKDKIKGLGGDDILFGLGGNDDITGGTGNDTIYGGAGNDKIDGGDGNDTLFGEAGNDKIDGGKGNDTIAGGSGNDKIDGGKGIDTAEFSGNYADYIVTAINSKGNDDDDDHDEGPGNNKLTVSDTVGGRDGTDTVKHVEFLKFNDALVDVQNNVTHFSDHTLDSSSYDNKGTATTADDEIFVGDGNLPTHYNIAVANDYDVELGLKIHYRTGDDILPTSVDADGTVHYVVPDGRQVVDPAHNVSSAAPNRAAWNFDFSVNTGINGNSQTLDAFDFKIIISDDDGNTKAYDLQHLGPGNTPWIDTPFTGGFADEDGLNPQLSQNSVNFGFAFLQAAFGPDFDSVGEQYDIQLQAFQGTTMIASVHDALILA